MEQANFRIYSELADECENWLYCLEYVDMDKCKYESAEISHCLYRIMYLVSQMGHMLRKR